jgi:hypothetical protein
VRDLEVAEKVRVQGLSLLASAREPGRDGGLPKAEDPHGGRVEPFGQRRQHDGNPAREGVFRRYNGVLRRALKVVRQA